MRRILESITKYGFNFFFNEFKSEFKCYPIAWQTSFLITIMQSEEDCSFVCWCFYCWYFPCPFVNRKNGYLIYNLFISTWSVLGSQEKGKLEFKYFFFILALCLSLVLNEQKICFCINSTLICSKVYYKLNLKSCWLNKSNWEFVWFIIRLVD